eukprot:1981014-Amphidinium_carterae.1
MEACRLQRQWHDKMRRFPLWLKCQTMERTDARLANQLFHALPHAASLCIGTYHYNRDALSYDCQLCLRSSLVALEYERF